MILINLATFIMHTSAFKIIDLSNDLRNITERDLDLKQFPLEACPPINLTSGAHPMSRAVCPWFYKNDVDYSRIPHTILKARCFCTACRVKSTRRQRFRCVEYHNTIMVLKKRPQSSDYRLSSERVPVGCYCVKQIIRSRNAG